MNDSSIVNSPGRGSVLAAALAVGLLGGAVAAVPVPQGEPVALPELARQRFALRANRGSLDRKATLALAAGLRWLAQHQDKDGKWDCDQFMKHDAGGNASDGPGREVHDVGVTGLALLVFLGDDNTMHTGPYKKVVEAGIGWLSNQQQENGLLGGNLSHDFIYDHAIACYAICEAYGLSGDKRLEPLAQKALDYLESHRNPYSMWRYQPRDNDNDTSVSSWCILACESGKLFGLRTNDLAHKLSAVWLDQVSDASGRHGYSKQGERSSRQPGARERFPVEKGEAMTAAGLFCRFVLGQDPVQKPIMAAAADLLLGRPPLWDEKGGSIDYYYWYYASHALFQMGEKPWAQWRASLHKALLPNQRTDGNFAGSWDPVSVWGEEGGRVYSTAMAALCLQAEYRHARIPTLTPLPWNERFKAANEAWLARRYGDFGKALDAAARPEGLTDAQELAIDGARRALEPLQNEAMAKVAELRESRNYEGAIAPLSQIADQFGGLPAGEAARALLDQWRRDPAVQREIRAHKLYRSILDAGQKKPGREGEKALHRRLSDFVATYGDTWAGQQAKAWLDKHR